MTEDRGNEFEPQQYVAGADTYLHLHLVTVGPVPVYRGTEDLAMRSIKGVLLLI